MALTRVPAGVPVAAIATAALLHTWERHVKSHAETRFGGKLKRQSQVLFCVDARSDVSVTPQRLWPGSQWTVAVHGAKGKCLMYVVQQAAGPPPPAPIVAYPLGPRKDKWRLNTSTTTSGTAGCAAPGSRARPTLHCRTAVRGHVLPQTAPMPSFSQRVPTTQSKKPPCNNTWWRDS